MPQNSSNTGIKLTELARCIRMWLLSPRPSGIVGFFVNLSSQTVRNIEGRVEGFYRINRLPPYVFAQVQALKLEARHKGEDIIDLGMGNPDQTSQDHFVDKLHETNRLFMQPRNSVS